MSFLIMLLYAEQMQILVFDYCSCSFYLLGAFVSVLFSFVETSKSEFFISKTIHNQNDFVLERMIRRSLPMFSFAECCVPSYYLEEENAFSFTYANLRIKNWLVFSLFVSH